MNECIPALGDSVRYDVNALGRHAFRVERAHETARITGVVPYADFRADHLLAEPVAHPRTVLLHGQGADAHPYQRAYHILNRIRQKNNRILAGLNRLGILSRETAVDGFLAGAGDAQVFQPGAVPFGARPAGVFIRSHHKVAGGVR